MKLLDWLKQPFGPRYGVNMHMPPVRMPAYPPGSPPAAPFMVLPMGAVVVPTPKYPEAERIAATLRDYPEDWAWKQKGYTLAHVPSGFTLWVGNKDYGLGEDHGSHRTDFPKPEQAIIWPAVEAWLERFKVGFTGRLPKVKITARRGTYWCVADGHPWAGAGNSPADAYRAWSRAVSIQARKDTNPEEYLHVWSAAL